MAKPQRLLLLSRWSTFRARAPPQVVPRLIVRGFATDDADRKDVQAQKSAFLRALDTSKKRHRKSTHKGGRSIKDTKASFPNKTKEDRSSKKLTLDEFFANLEKKAEPTKRPTRERAKNGNHHKSQTSPRPLSKRQKGSKSQDMGSFFENVNALMESKKQETAEGSILSVPSRPLSVADIMPPPTHGEYIPNDNYDTEAWDQYNELLGEIIEGPRFLARLRKKRTKKNDEKEDVDKDTREERKRRIVEWLRSGIPMVKIGLPTLEETVHGNDQSTGEIGSTPIGRNTDRSKAFGKELFEQKERFMTQLGWGQEEYDVAVGALVALGGLCAKKCMAPPLDVAWSKLKEMGYPMHSKDVLHNYLYVSSTFSLPKSSTFMNHRPFGSLGFGDGDAESEHTSVLDFLGRTPDTESIDEEENATYVDVAAEVALCHDFFHEATEQSTGIHVRRLVQLGKANEAEKLLDGTMKSDDLRLRTYAPIYQSYLEQGDVSSAFKLFVKMKGGEAVLLQTETYIQLIACIAENGYFRHEAREIEGIENLPYSARCGPDLFNLLASELADHSVEISSAAAKRLYNAFQRGFRGEDAKMNLRPLNLLESLRIDNNLALADELIASRVEIDATTGKCSRSGAQLRLINLDSDQKQKFRDGLLYLVSSSYMERHRVASKVNVAEKLKNFGDWLQRRDGEMFTAIIDGPNIAYYMQNFQQGSFNYHQIKFVVDALENMGEKVLVVLPKKYTYDSFVIQVGGRSTKQTLSQKERKIRDDLLADNKACVVPVGSLDDYYWMFASVSMDEEFVPPDNPDGRWPGNRPMLISNDKLRDHKMSLLEPRLFRRWYSNFLVNFTFSAFVNDECVDREIGFRTADFYSREIQGNTDENGTTWHFPVGDWNENESLCIRIPRRKEN